MQCPKCKKPFIDGVTVIMPFKISCEGNSFCEPCGREFQKIKNTVDEMFEMELMKAYYYFIDRTEEK